MYRASYTVQSAKSVEDILMGRQKKTEEEKEEERKLRWEIERPFFKSTFSHVRRRNVH